MKIISKGKPANQIKSIRADSKKALIFLATLKGVTTEDIMKLTGWAKFAASSAIATDIVPLGYKVTLDEGVWRLNLTLPRDPDSKHLRSSFQLPIREFSCLPLLPD
jgi:hypothetical protein